jgi:hypothetical protein
MEVVILREFVQECLFLVVYGLVINGYIGLRPLSLNQGCPV